MRSPVVIAILIALVAAVYQWGAPWFYIAKPMQARVVDAETKKPLEGVIVVAMWKLEGGIHYHQVGVLETMESVTDKDGYFRIPGWGPKWRPYGRLTIYDPVLYFYKEGYRPTGRFNDYMQGFGLSIAEVDARSRGVIRRSLFDGKTIELEKFTGDILEFNRHLRFIETSIRFLRDDENCAWKKIPRTLVAFDRIAKEAKQAAGQKGVVIGALEADSVRDGERCGSVTEYLREYLK